MFGKKKNTGRRSPLSLVKLTLTLTPKVYERIEQMKEQSDCPDDTELVRRALAHYDDMLEVVNTGGNIIVEPVSGPKEIVMLY